MSKAPLILCVALAGCVESEPDQAEHLAPVGPGDSGDIWYEREQGRYILGSVPDGLAASDWHFRIPANQQTFTLAVNAAGIKGVNGTHLVATEGANTYGGADPWFNNKILSGPMGRLWIRGTAQGTSSVGVTNTVYFLDYELVTPGSTQWVPYCTGGGGAIPISGYYDSRRVHQPGTFISFGCMDGVARKCNNWGYIAGNAGPGDDNWDHHQACTGMANANYCGDGEPRTREKTPILMRDAVPGYGNEDPYDFDHPNPLPGNPDDYYIEAAWKKNGRPFCLARVRWQALAPNECGTELPDPRYSKNSEAKFCDHWSISQLLAQPDVVLVNGSKVMDASLHRWKNSNGDYVTTIRGYFIDRNNDGVPDTSADPVLSSIPPFPGYNTHVTVEGMVLRNLPGTLSETQMGFVYLRELAGDLHLTDTGNEREDAGFEGYSFPTQTTTLSAQETIAGQALKLCTRGNGNLDNMVGLNLGCSLVDAMQYAMPAP